MCVCVHVSVCADVIVRHTRSEAMLRNAKPTPLMKTVIAGACGAQVMRQATSVASAPDWPLPHTTSETMSRGGTGRQRPREHSGANTSWNASTYKRAHIAAGEPAAPASTRNWGAGALVAQKTCTSGTLYACCIFGPGNRRMLH